MVVSHYERIQRILDPTLKQGLAAISASSYEEFIGHPLISQMYSTDPLQFAAANSTLQLLFHLHQMRKHGEKLFVVEPDTCTLLFNTDVRGVTTDLFRTPYVEQLFVLPPDLTTLTLYDPRTGNHRLCGVYVWYDRQELKIMAVGEPNQNSVNEFDDTFAYYRFNLGPGDLKTQVREQIAAYGKDHFLVLTGGVYNIEVAERLFNFILNLALYTCSPEADTHFESWAEIDTRFRHLHAQGRKRKELIARLKNQGRYLKIRLGSKTRLTTEQRQAFATGSTAKRTLVMGHWMHFHIGAGRTETILKWRQPFWRGTGELSNTPHLM